MKASTRATIRHYATGAGMSFLGITLAGVFFLLMAFTYNLEASR